MLDHGLRFRTVRAVTRWLLTDLLFESREEIRYGAKRRIQLALNWDVFLHLYRHGRPDFAAAVFYGSDTLAHRVWRFAFPRDFGLDPDASRPYGEPLRAYYRDVDAVLGELLDEIDTSTTFMLVSDHGFGSYGGEGELGSELEWEPRISRLADLAGLEIPEQASVAAIARRAYISFHGTSEEVDPVRQRVLAELTALRLVDTGQRLFDLSPTSSGQLGIQVSKGLAVGMLDANDEVAGSDEARHRLGDLLEIEERSGTHTEEGVIMLHGPAIAPGVTIEASLVDVVPTALYLFGLPIGRDMSGRLLEKALRDGQLRERRPAYLATWQERVVISRERTAPSNDEVLEQQLRELGYIE